METVIYTQRVEVHKGYNERRDCADQNIAKFIETCGYLPVPVPNIKSIAEAMFLKFSPAGIVLTGGNSLAKYGGDAPERDETEKCLLDMAVSKGVPVYGFCRGMQVILDYCGCTLVDVKNHVAVRHKINGSLGEFEVNSYHNQGCIKVKAPLKVLAKADDGVIEAVEIKEKKILGTMWHPERGEVFKEDDIARVQELFN